MGVLSELMMRLALLTINFFLFHCALILILFYLPCIQKQYGYLLACLKATETHEELCLVQLLSPVCDGNEKQTNNAFDCPLFSLSYVFVVQRFVLMYHLSMSAPVLVCHLKILCWNGKPLLQRSLFFTMIIAIECFVLCMFQCFLYESVI